MKRSLTATTRLAALTGVFAVTLTAVGAFAGGGVINACAKKKAGTLRVVAPGKQCNKSERAISWSQQGSPGPRGDTGAPGPRGAPGAEGPKGDTGPSNSYDKLMTGFTQTQLTTSYANIIGVNVPAGDYTVIAKAVAANNGTAADGVDCQIAYTDAGADHVQDFVTATLPSGSHSPLVLTASATPTGSTTINIQCRNQSSTNNTGVVFAHLIAQNVGTITFQ